MPLGFDNKTYERLVTILLIIKPLLYAEPAIHTKPMSAVNAYLVSYSYPIVYKYISIYYDFILVSLISRLPQAHAPIPMILYESGLFIVEGHHQGNKRLKFSPWKLCTEEMKQLKHLWECQFHCLSYKQTTEQGKGQTHKRWHIWKWLMSFLLSASQPAPLSQIWTFWTSTPRDFRLTPP